MTTTVLRPIGYTNSYQELTWTGGSTSVTAYLWGGGGGGGGTDSKAGGTGGGGGYAVHTFTVNPGDVIGVAVGGGGGRGFTGFGGGGGGGIAGASLAPMIFDTRSAYAIGSSVIFSYTAANYCGFLNAYGIWGVNPRAPTFNATYAVNFPSSGAYTFTGSADDRAHIFLDDVEVLYVRNQYQSWQVTINVSGGSHLIRIEASGESSNQNAVGLTVVGPSSEPETVGYNGGFGGGAGPSGSSGGGGGGGGATVILLNGSVMAVAAGGAGGGGAGQSVGQNAPGDRGQSTWAACGQNGRTNPGGDGAGGGAGGGGVNGGQGGQTGAGDSGSDAGVPGLSLGDTTEAPTGRNPGGRTSPYYAGTPGVGGLSKSAGTNGYIAMVFDLPGTFVNVDGTFTPVSKIWVKNNDVWSPVRQTLLKENGVWKATLGGMPPIFTSQSGKFGTVNRDWVL